MRILVTGGAGYLGTELVHALVRMPDVKQVVVYDNLSRGKHSLFIGRSLPRHIVRFVHADILDQRRLKAELAGIDVVYHLAAKVHTPFEPEDPHSFEQINHWGCAELATSVEASDVSRLIFSSSTAVYGYTDTPATEDSRCSPVTHYGIAKYRGEKQIARLGNRLSTYTVRCANVYGYSPAMRFDAVINRLMFEANFFNRVNIYSSGHQARAFVNVDRAVQGLVFLLEGTAPPGVYNLVDDNFSVLDIALIAKELMPDLEFNFVDQHMPMGNLTVSPQTRLSALLPAQGVDLKADLVALAQKFAFQNASI
ncbi:NAD-dependent epimerase/dehydratase [Haliea sp. E1-2-M8]|uniref:NAD-dependent epimerase/dehydratase family protein n=1 Tax=Haliea sp. E1-2-M8 TaxID=3064706 RepID=UPI00271DB997|nr:NAD-dependent epimerase/dehydratase [Haliea sp. E1-2-M8]MDO8861561.1 NAD-dependent epimerase/dehydratase [Haliea sp. E1-2-M8]